MCNNCILSQIDKEALYILKKKKNMHLYIPLLILLIATIVLPDLFFYKKMTQRNFYAWVRILSLLPTGLFVSIFMYIRFGLNYIHDFEVSGKLQWVFFAYLVIYMPKIMYIGFFYLNRWYNTLFRSKTRIIRQVGFIISIAFSTLFIYGNIVTRDNFYVKEQVVEVENLPKAFEEYKIILFADLHLGSWLRKYEIMTPLVDSINAQHPDLIVFAGDMVNNFHDEMDGWETSFNKMKAKDGKLAILGNHDYGDYAVWKSADEKAKNARLIKEKIEGLGFDLLVNEHRFLVKDKDSLAVVGVENWGTRHFSKYGDLRKAALGLNKAMKKIVLTHDPTHWDAQIVGQPDMFLTLSGHTHAAQLGFTKWGIQFSPSRLIFEQWDGLYKKGEQQIYVNRGLGYVGVPMRVGVPPEISVIILKNVDKRSVD